MKERKKIAHHLQIPTSTVKWKGRKDGEPMMIGYARVSMNDQSNQRQIDELVRFGVAPVDIFQDKQSGKTADRPGWKACFREFQEGDHLVVYSLDRLGRKVKDLIEIEEALFRKGVKLRVICQPVDCSNATGRMYFHMLCMMAQWEREWNWERSQHGLKTARERGVVGGQPSGYPDAPIATGCRAIGRR
jgi:DNA invertase Pin-like site-specific DNA recombinase